MKKVLAITMILVAAFALNALAYDDLITNDTAYYKEAGTMEAGAKLLYTTAKNAFDDKGDKADKDMENSATQMRIPLSFKYGVMENLEAFAIIPFISLNK